MLVQRVDYKFELFCSLGWDYDRVHVDFFLGLFDISLVLLVLLWELRLIFAGRVLESYLALFDVGPDNFTLNFVQ